MRYKHKIVAAFFWWESWIRGEFKYLKKAEATFRPHGPHAKNTGTEEQERSGSLTVLLTQSTKVPLKDCLPLDFLLPEETPSFSSHCE